MTRPRAADDFATIRARLTELRRERELASKQTDGDEDASDAPRLPRVAEGRQRPEKGDWSTFAASRRYLPARQR